MKKNWWERKQITFTILNIDCKRTKKKEHETNYIEEMTTKITTQTEHWQLCASSLHKNLYVKKVEYVWSLHRFYLACIIGLWASAHDTLWIRTTPISQLPGFYYE